MIEIALAAAFVLVAYLIYYVRSKSNKPKVNNVNKIETGEVVVGTIQERAQQIIDAKRNEFRATVRNLANKRAIEIFGKPFDEFIDGVEGRKIDYDLKNNAGVWAGRAKLDGMNFSLWTATDNEPFEIYLARRPYATGKFSSDKDNFQLINELVDIAKHNDWYYSK